MKDLSEVLLRARDEYPHMDFSEIKYMITSIKSMDISLRVDWDEGAGEEWVRVIHPTIGLIMMMHVVIRVAFIRSGYDFTMLENPISDWLLVKTENYSLNEWMVDVDKLALNIPEMTWHASVGAVDPDCFSLDDLYYATI